MAKVEWGIKRFCQKCHAKYYDMQRNPITCPKCGTVFQLEILKSRDDAKVDFDVEELAIIPDIDPTELEDFEPEDIEEAVDIKDIDKEEKHS
ncbi:MAG: TIGR02300 family protein [Alphaproteobacteria bacterium]|nr:TIGR02300 family protein [Alphaproteobacteria bacterium]MDP3532053.1 TIGR02300 family protein [Alphaproteobacteria bacterium]